MKTRPFLLIALGAFALYLSMPGLNIWTLSFVALAPLVYVVRMRQMNGFLAGTLFGFLFFAGTVAWLRVPISVYGNAPLVASIGAIAVFSLYLALYFGLFGYALSRSRGVVFPALIFVLGELLRGALLTGFPWANLGQTLYRDLPALQIASFVGESGLSFGIVAINILFAEAAMQKKREMYVAPLALILALHLAGGAKLFLDSMVKEPVASVRIIQPGYEQQDKWNKDKKEQIIALGKEMLKSSLDVKRDLIVMPENVFPLFIQRRPDITSELDNASKISPVVFGLIRYTDEADGSHIYHNSLGIVENATYSIYDKQHLVPFGEYFPLSGIFKPIDYYFFRNAEGFTPGSGPKLLLSGNIRIAPLICYEGAYSSLLSPMVRMGANVVVVVSNDAWFGETWGRKQHFAIDVLRAAEFGRTLIRATQSGYSAFILPNGRVDGMLGINEKGYIDREIPLKEKKTLFGIIGYGWLLLPAGWIFYRKYRMKDM